MPVEEQQDRMRSMRSLLAQFNVYRWAGKMLVDAARLRNQERVAGRLAERSAVGRRGLTMRYLLSRACRPILARLARERTLCAFDFDGTLAPIVDHPDQAGMRDRTRKLLARVAALYPCVIISGRARADLLGKLGGVKVARVIGNHGAETESDRAKVAPPGGAMEGRPGARAWHASRSVGGRQGPLSGRALPPVPPESAKPAGGFSQPTQNLKQVRVFGGKQVVNLVAEGAPHKGEALAAERDRLGCNWVLYVGDDENDEDAFALDGNVVPVRIGRKRHSHARYYLRTQAEIDKLLELLVFAFASLKRRLAADARRSTRRAGGRQRLVDHEREPPGIGRPGIDIDRALAAEERRQHLDLAATWRGGRRASASCELGSGQLVIMRLQCLWRTRETAAICRPEKDAETSPPSRRW